MREKKFNNYEMERRWKRWTEWIQNPRGVGDCCATSHFEFVKFEEVKNYPFLISSYELIEENERGRKVVLRDIYFIRIEYGYRKYTELFYLCPFTQKFVLYSRGGWGGYQTCDDIVEVLFYLLHDFWSDSTLKIYCDGYYVKELGKWEGEIEMRYLNKEYLKNFLSAVGASGGLHRRTSHKGLDAPDPAGIREALTREIKPSGEYIPWLGWERKKSK